MAITAAESGTMAAAVKHIRTSALEVAYEESGEPGGIPVFLLHGWPYDPRCYDNVVPPLTEVGCRVLVPYLRGFGATRFVSTGTPRCGQQAALGSDLRELMDALAIERAVLAGYDWGGRAACIVGRSGRNACAASLPRTAITSRTLPVRCGRKRRNRNAASGTSGIFRLSAGARD
jgi:Alpha/beta hydrolase family